MTDAKLKCRHCEGTGLEDASGWGDLVTCGECSGCGLILLACIPADERREPELQLPPEPTDEGDGEDVFFSPQGFYRSD